MAPGIRALLFYASRRYLLRHLYHDLQDLSAKTPSDASVVFDAGETELEVLPTPSSASTAPTIVRKRPFHSALSRALFSLCFTESCTLFFLLICQALELFHPRCVNSMRIVRQRLSLILRQSAPLQLGGLAMYPHGRHRTRDPPLLQPRAQLQINTTWK